MPRSNAAACAVPADVTAQLSETKNFADAQKYSKMCLGKVPVEFPSFFKDPDVPRRTETAYLFDKDYQYYWHPSNAENQWWLDGLRIDPSELIENQQVIFEHGMDQPVVQCKLANASVGSLPSVLVYIAVHKDFGTHVFYPYHGAKGGGGDKTETLHMYDGFRFWYSELKDDELKFIIERKYYNQAQGLKAFEKKGSDARRERLAGPFDADNFMVRSLPSRANKSGRFDKPFGRSLGPLLSCSCWHGQQCETCCLRLALIVLAAPAAVVLPATDLYTTSQHPLSINQPHIHSCIGLFCESAV